jgi:hypothetical protein
MHNFLVPYNPFYASNGLAEFVPFRDPKCKIINPANYLQKLCTPADFSKNPVQYFEVPQKFVHNSGRASPRSSRIPSS